MQKHSVFNGLLFSVVLALAAVGLTCSASLSPAKAQSGGITCNTTNTNSMGWPYNASVTACSNTTPANFTKLQSGLHSVVVRYQHQVTSGGVTTTVGYGPQLQALSPRVYLFNSPADYATFFGSSNCPKLGAHVNGETWTNPTCSITGNKSYTVVLEENDLLAANQWVNRIAAHEMGHWFDTILLGTSASPYSTRSLFTHEMAVGSSGTVGDYPQFNALQYACASPSRIFNNQQTYSNSPKYICANNGAGPGLATGFSGSNTNVLNTAVSMFYSSPQELFAEETAVLTGNVDQDPRVDTYLNENTWFACTKTLLNSLLSYGVPPGVSPSPLTFPNTCPAS